MITLTKAFKLCQIRDDEVVSLVRAEEIGKGWPSYLYTGKEVRNRLDMKATMVVRIRPRFEFGEYEGMEFVIQRRSDR